MFFRKERFLALLALFPLVQTAPSQNAVQVTKDFLKEFFRGNIGSNGVNHLPGAVRLAFHDCVGGCDGCINMQRADNKGLEDTIAALDVFYLRSQSSARLPAYMLMSRADYWTLASIAAIEVAIENNNNNCNWANCRVANIRPIPFYWGRRDCPETPNSSAQRQFCDPVAGNGPNMAFFKNEFGFEPHEVTALLGAHTLGSAHPQDSGFSGSWIPGQQTWFNNEFYVRLIRSDITYINDNPGVANHPQFTGRTNDPRGGAFMLQSDMALIKDIQPTSFGGGISACSVSPNQLRPPCANSDTSGWVAYYANNQNEWVWDFARVYIRMLNHGYENVLLTPYNLN